ncbi:hypothetical protein F5Y15DRAFT_411560 [Xylariaceae sp. FL0016]|nr:hypothetical protein F5Y15DRAFT_411560 [Xylariaceae sp. FL0016]
MPTLSSSRKIKASTPPPDDIDAITPCPAPSSSPSSDNEPTPLPSSHSIEYHRARAQAQVQSRSTSPSSLSSYLDDETRSRRRASVQAVQALEEGTRGDPAALWRRMLALQQTYGCYNSARMSAALEAGDAGMLLPSKACLDLLNENMVMWPAEAEPVPQEWPSGMMDLEQVKGH